MMACPSFSLLYLFGSGLVFWLGTGLVLGGFCGRIWAKKHWSDRLSVYSVDFGLVLVVLSAVPLPYVVYVAAIGVTILWLVGEKSPRPWWQRRRYALRVCLVGAWLLAVLWELPYQFTPRMISRKGQIHVIGDSISAGLGGKAVPWPDLLAESRNWQVHSYARAGATTSQALLQAERLPDEAEIVIVEIGGNDMLSGKPVADFERDLDALLSLVRQKSQQVVMFELPLPLLFNEYGRVQRMLSARHEVRLAPKRLLMGVLSTGNATEDSVHLTQSGHQQLAEVVSGMIE